MINYDPSVGRFTAPAPLGDTGGDHDLYDYCIDDPVTMNDPTGLIAPAVPVVYGAFLGAKALALGIAGAVTYATAGGIDVANKDAEGNKTTDAVGKINIIAPYVLETALLPLSERMIGRGGSRFAWRQLNYQVLEKRRKFSDKNE